MGDVNGDGRDDLIVTVANPVFEDNPGDQGGLHVVPGSPAGLSPAESRFIAWDELADDLGVWLTNYQQIVAADFDGDGFDDLACSAWVKALTGRMKLIGLGGGRA